MSVPPDVGNLSYTDNKADVYARKSSNLVLSADLNRDGYQDWIYRTTSGAVYWDHVVLNSARDDGSWASTEIFTNWKTRNNGTFSSPSRVGGGWSQYNALVGKGDFTGDGKADLLIRNVGGPLYLYPGTGKATSEIFGTPKPLGTGFQRYGIFG
ncbi:VCBS repeat-containing protein [Streptomyces sp. NPDC051576]|uniref:FG-GAP repeat domain-containing protein n=1 Tax=Streptomyces sp. NPDC051576 TaxID=3155803 RepID=UPI003419B64B